MERKKNKLEIFKKTQSLKEIKYKIMSDRIEAGTYMIASALTGGNLKIHNVDPKIISTEINILKKIRSKNYH